MVTGELLGFLTQAARGTAQLLGEPVEGHGSRSSSLCDVFEEVSRCLNVLLNR